MQVPGLDWSLEAGRYQQFVPVIHAGDNTLAFRERLKRDTGTRLLCGDLKFRARLLAIAIISGARAQTSGVAPAKPRHR